MPNNLPPKSFSINSRIIDKNKNKNKNKIKIVRGKSYSCSYRTSIDVSLQRLELIDKSNENVDESNEDQPEISLDQLTQEIVSFVESSSSNAGDDHDLLEQTFTTPNTVIIFLKKLESMIQQYVSASEEDSLMFGKNVNEDPLFIAAITRLSSLIQVFGRFKSDNTMPVINQASIILHHAMVIFEYELRYLLEEAPAPQDLKDESNQKSEDPSKDIKDQEEEEEEEESEKKEENVDKEEEKNEITFPPFSSETINSIRLISNAMIISGYGVECFNVFIISRRQMFEEELKKQGFVKISVDEVQKMNWDTLESLIATWICCFKHCLTTLFPSEHKFYEFVLEGHTSAKCRLLADLSSAVFALLVNFAEAVSMTKRSSEKLFKFLDMYETIRDTSQLMKKKKESIYPDIVRNEHFKVEFTAAQCWLRESVISVFNLLENSIKNDTTKTSVPDGAVHPLTRYTMNYLVYTSEYKQTLKEVFHDCLGNEESHICLATKREEQQSPFEAQLLTIMELLDANLDAKSELYKDQSLQFIFLMNNRRYMLQRVKGTPEIRQVLGDNWCRKRSSDVRKYHKGYQRETWCKVLECFNQEGLLVNGKIQKSLVKERFNNFNRLFDEIRKTQSAWIVNDEQLQTELRVSISSIMIPAYRSFLARFGQNVTPGRQVKYIKYQPEDIETVIEELFDGRQQNMSMTRRRN